MYEILSVMSLVKSVMCGKPFLGYMCLKMNFKHFRLWTWRSFSFPRGVVVRTKKFRRDLDIVNKCVDIGVNRYAFNDLMSEVECVIASSYRQDKDFKGTDPKTQG